MCGRPTSGEPEPIVDVPRLILTAPVLPPPVPEARVSFANPAALRIAFAAAALSILLDTIPLLGLLFVIWAMGAGFMAVWLFQKRTGLPLSVGNGAKLGWITGVFSSVLLTIMVTVTVVFNGDKLAEEFRRQAAITLSKDPNYQQVLSTFENPASLATMIIFLMLFIFLLLSLASVAGGALGARFSNKQ
jgi:hypothetical protein